jgi:hypothetical protein
MRYSKLLFAIVVFVSCSTAKKTSVPDVTAAPSPIILDHIYSLVPHHGREAIKRLAETGFVVNPKVFQMTGAGLASRIILLDNVYLEILWVDDSVSYTSEEALQRLKRKTWFAGNPVSPFGIAFRRAPGVGDSIPIPNRASAPEPAGSWAKEGSVFNDITDEDDTLSTYLFVIPTYMGYDQNMEQRKQKKPELLQHPNGVKTLTKVVIYGPKDALPRKEKYIRNISMLKFVRATENYAELEFDHGQQKQRRDLRPLLPLILNW